MNIGLIVAILAIVLVFQGTRTTGPNPSFMKQVPTTEEIENMPGSNRKRCYELFTEIHQKNPGLAEELGRIPEFADNEVSDKDLEALVNMSDYFSTIESKYPDGLNQAFEEILNTGIKDKRKYCSPLRFLFWLAEEKKFDEESISYSSNPLEYFSLKKLISLGINRLPKKTNNFNEVVSVLNSPKIIQRYLENHIIFVKDIGDYHQSPKYTFERGKGDCEDFAILSNYCLVKNGYNSYIISVNWGSGLRDGHAVGVYKENGKLFVIDEKIYKRPFQIVIKGPYSSNREIIKSILYGRSLIRYTISKWNNFSY